MRTKNRIETKYPSGTGTGAEFTFAPSKQEIDHKLGQQPDHEPENGKDLKEAGLLMPVMPYAFNRSGSIRPICISVVKSYILLDMTRADDAEETFLSDFNCAQAVLSSFGKDLDLDPVTARKITCGLGAGMAGTDLVCGAVTGGILAISLKYGKVRREDVAARDRTYALVREFITQFKERNGTVMCTGLIGSNLSDPAGFSKAKESGAFRRKCPKFVRDAVEIAERFIR